ncbi:heparan-alpha-glucosaminide N-acetyltransferase [Atopobium minutum]|uniref:heparan-alpha-glucosaminide N-acetyltransferase n=1 Tax=Atopobium minutum TaxID=1381 RepID=UPI0029113A76|nr:heparan-alpha-glucosaminide N-acetyltransferase [Atopobium minutum]MDU5129478.1 heparan-alpha-glucosaminide N-acetyltransferase [Atopobium minutum]
MKKVQTQRVHGFDVLRGIAVVSMVFFHLCYDLTSFSPLALPWFDGLLEDLWRNSISWTFLGIAGCMACYSKNNIKRSCKLLLLAFIIYFVTSIVTVDTPINFGIIYCLGVSTLLAGIIQHCKIKINGYKLGALRIVVFFCLLPLSSGYIDILGMRLMLPSQLYSTPYFSWLGLPGPGFASGDYYPLLPYGLIYFAAWSFCTAWQKTGIPSWFINMQCKPLELVGRHALLIYVLHQPLLLGLVQLLFL